jgi:hypothetical protein
VKTEAEAKDGRRSVGEDEGDWDSLDSGKSTGVDLKTKGKRFPEVSRKSRGKFKNSKGFEKYTTKHRSKDRNENLN